MAPAGGAGAQSRSVDAVFNAVGRDYARVLGLPVLAGRDFTDAELAPGAEAWVAIIDDELAQRLWPGESAFGRLMQFLDAEGPEAGRPHASSRHRPGREALAQQSPAVPACLRAAGTALRERHDAAASRRRQARPNAPCWQRSPA